MKKLFVIALWVVAAGQAVAQEPLTYQRPAEEIARILEAPLTPLVTFSPDKQKMVLLDRSDFPSIEELSRPELRIAGLRINPDNFGPSRQNYSIGITVKTLSDKKDHAVSGLPSPLLASGFTFSPDSRHAAFLQSFSDRIELWVIDLSTYKARKLGAEPVNAVLGGYSWFSDSKSLIYAAVPSGLSPLEVRSRVPSGPVVEENLGKKAPNPTYQDLLKNPYDEKAFEYYATSTLVIVSLDGTALALPQAGLHNYFSPSPDGSLILTKTIHRPYSYIVPAFRFPQRVQVIDKTGNVVKDIIDLPLVDNVPRGFDAVQKGPRSHGWRSDEAATVYWIEARDGGDPKQPAEIRDAVHTWKAPFNGTGEVLVDLPLRYGGMVWGNATTAVAYESWYDDRKERAYLFNPSTKEKNVLIERMSEDAYNDPGTFMMTTNTYGRQVMLLQADGSAYLTGDGSSPEGDMPFLDQWNLKTGKKSRLWQCKAPNYEYVVSLIEPKKMQFVTSRESLTENQNYFLRGVTEKGLVSLTAFAHPYPQIKDVTKRVLQYKRADGVDMTADLYLPPGYKKEDGPLPAFVWAYPVEYKSKDNAGQVKGSKYTFTRVSSGGPLFWVTRGYAVLNNAAMPVVGEGKEEPNDSYVKQVVMNAEALVDYVTREGLVDRNRIGVGGHSYGAFMTANLLAHCDLFRAGIARSGAYNRTLTPFGFQSEQRTYWDAPDVYYNMSPFSFADKIKEPILLIHGEADNNQGTFPVQTERLYNAIKGHGGTVRYVLLPYEAHGYRAKESVLHTLWEMDQWLEKYVKNAGEKVVGSR
jgi:dipeptidyl aminopeptidase/acylaminoacyl peptidase